MGGRKRKWGGGRQGGGLREKVGRQKEDALPQADPMPSPQHLAPRFCEVQMHLLTSLETTVPAWLCTSREMFTRECGLMAVGVLEFDPPKNVCDDLGVQ